jgi:hypothetical protein
VKVKVGHLGTIVAYFEAIRITRVSGSGWAGFCEYLAGPILSFLGFESLLFSANLWCSIFSCFCVTCVLKFLSEFLC